VAEKATITNTVTGDPIRVEFNPEEYTLSKDINYAQTGVPGLSAPIVQFVSGNAQTLEMELLLDSYEPHMVGGQEIKAGSDVRVLTRQLTGLMAIDPATHAPPVLVFAWASLTFECVLSRAVERYIMFRTDGTPVRARVQVTFSEFRNADLEAKEIKRETADYSKHYVVGQGESLSVIAWREYGDPALWRPIALRNGIDDPRRVPDGTRLLLPSLPFRDPDSGQVYA
jgi:nucleoid-associated protein YgaU